MLPAPAQVSPDRKLIDTRAARNLAHRAVDVVVQHDDRALLRRESLERDQQLLIGVSVMNGAFGQRSAQKVGAALEIPLGKTEG